MTDEVIGKLEEVFALGGSDREACFFAGINPDSLYEYQKEHPEFTERKEMLKEQPVLLARRTVVKAIEQPQHAEWYLERKAKKEFASRQEHTGADGQPLFEDEEAKKTAEEAIKGITGTGAAKPGK